MILKEEGYEDTRGNRERKWKGLALRDDNDDDKTAFPSYTLSMD